MAVDISNNSPFLYNRFKGLSQELNIHNFKNLYANGIKAKRILKNNHFIILRLIKLLLPGGSEEGDGEEGDGEEGDGEEDEGEPLIL